MGCINWAKQIQGLKTNEKLGLVMAADRAPKESGVCDCPVSWMAMDCGWTVQQMNRILKRLSQLGLLSIDQRYPGSGDISRIFILDIAIDPAEWRRPTKLLRKPDIMSTSDFRNRARQAMKSNHAMREFDIWFTSLRLVGVQRETIICRVPNQDFADAIRKKYETLILKLAQEHIDSAILRLRLWCPPKKEKIPEM